MMTELAHGLLLASGVVVAGLVATQLLFALASVPSLLALQPGSDSLPVTRFVVIVPAHNEELLIDGLVRSVLASDYPPDLRRLVVVADNCTDRTADRARRAGAECYERLDQARRGKPYALDWIVRRLPLERYDAVVIVDADTVVDRGFLGAMDRHIRRGERAIQGYFGVLNPEETWLTRLGVVPAALKFRLQFPGKERLGLSCPLAGNGMCFAADLMREKGWNAFSLTENWEYYILLTLDDVVTTVAPEARIYSQVARSLAQGETQRVRWAKGRMETLAKYWRRLLILAVLQPSPSKFDALVELARPSHAILLLSSVVLFGVSTALYVVEGLAWPARLFGFAVGGQVVLLAGAMLVARLPWRSWLALALVPYYLGWKVIVSLKAVLTRRQKQWQRTDRHESR
jgi:cellulose synthase/poly-beta-1,6-N-acetylglucosamine synthase-like glycosyltransferase